MQEEGLEHQEGRVLGQHRSGWTMAAGATIHGRIRGLAHLFRLPGRDRQCSSQDMAVQGNPLGQSAGQWQGFDSESDESEVCHRCESDVVTTTTFCGERKCFQCFQHDRCELCAEERSRRRDSLIVLEVEARAVERGLLLCLAGRATMREDAPDMDDVLLARALLASGALTDSGRVLESRHARYKGIGVLVRLVLRGRADVAGVALEFLGGPIARVPDGEGKMRRALSRTARHEARARAIHAPQVAKRLLGQGAAQAARHAVGARDLTTPPPVRQRCASACGSPIAADEPEP